MLAIGPLTGLALFIFRFCTGNHPSGGSAARATCDRARVAVGPVKKAVEEAQA